MEQANSSNPNVPSVPQEETVVVPVQVENDKSPLPDLNQEGVKQEKAPSKDSYEKAEFMA